MTDTIDKWNMFRETLTQEEQSDLYWLLSVIRGPDAAGETRSFATKADVESIKMSTSTKVRKLLFPQDSWTVNPVKQSFAAIERLCNWHFAAHVADADAVLRKLDREPLLQEEGRKYEV
jgi:hypothetical protein